MAVTPYNLVCKDLGIKSKVDRESQDWGLLEKEFPKAAMRATPAFKTRTHPNFSFHLE